MSNINAALSGSREFMGSGGRWASERMLEALKAGRPFSTKELRTLDTLRRDEWKSFDDAVVRAGTIRLRGVADLYEAGLVKKLTNGFGKTVLEWENVTDMDPATLSMDGISRTDNDRLEFDYAGVPLPIIHKDWFLHMRHIAASRESGEPLDTMQAEAAGRVCGELAEVLLFQGTTKKFRGLSIYGYMTHPSRNTGGFITNGNWAQAAKTGENMLADVQKMITGLQADRFNGPYWLYVGADASVPLGSDFKASSDKPTRSRLLETEGLEKIQVVDSLPAGNLIMVQPSRDVIQLIEGAPLQNIQWDVEGGMRVNFKSMQILVPNLRADSAGRMGVYHMS